MSPRPLALLAGVGLILACAAPAQAVAADPGRSRVSVEAPVLAPGVVGSAPVSGELAADGRFALRASVASASTGNAFYDTALRQVLGGTVEFHGVAAAPSRSGRRSGGATIYVAGRAARIPVLVRTISGQGGTTLRTHFALSLAHYGVRTTTGASPGPVWVAVTAFFPAR